MPPPTDAERLARFLAPHLTALRRAAYRLCRSAADAEDLVQEVCLRAYERLDDPATIGAPRTWLLRVQYRLHVDGLRRAGPGTEPLDALASAGIEAADGDDPEHDAETAVLAERVAAAWPSLTPDQQALLAFQAEGYTLAELAEATGLPLTALKARLHRARVRLGKLLQAQEPPVRAAAGSGDTR